MVPMGNETNVEMAGLPSRRFVQNASEIPRVGGRATGRTAAACTAFYAFAAFATAVFLLLAFAPQTWADEYGAPGATAVEAPPGDAAAAEPNPDPAGVAAVTDSPTYGTWSGLGTASTDNVGRVWADKSVYTDGSAFAGEAGGGAIEKTPGADFLVSLSALSSAMSLVTENDQQPLDILLVLDRSGSMDEEVSFYNYSPVYADQIDETGGTGYYTPAGNDYVAVGRVGGENGFERWELDGSTVYPAVSDTDGAAGHVRFYTRTETKINYKDALRQAVESFIDIAAGQENPERNRISIVSFSSTATIDADFTAVSAESAVTLKETVGKMVSAGKTYPDAAFAAAQREFTSQGRPEAKRVLIFFTDGHPEKTGSDRFSNSIASNTVNIAHGLKEEGTAIYTVCMVREADPAVTDDNGFNAYMNGVSSNFPKAWADGVDPDSDDVEPGENNHFTVEWGDGSTENGFYIAASDANELEQIFKNIAKAVSIPADVPTLVRKSANPECDGYITFTDVLGDYMEVKGFNAIVLGDQICTSVTPSDNGDGTTTYSFDGAFDGNGVYRSGDLANVKITVAPGQGIEGDTVTVRIPASLIPLHMFDVTEGIDGHTEMRVTPSSPLRVLYSVGLRPDVVDGLANPDAELGAYIASHGDSRSSVYFYSNDYVAGNRDGRTVVRFEPSPGNAYYRFVNVTQLYTQDEGGGYALASGEYDPGTTYYYRHTRYMLDDGGARTETEYLPADHDDIGGHTVVVDGKLMVAAGTRRTSPVAADVADKVGNETETATRSVSSSWDAGERGAEVVEAALGNNGRLAVPLPSALRVTKAVVADSSLGASVDADSFSDREFAVTVHVDGMAGKTATGRIEDSRSLAEGAPFEATFDERGDYACRLRAGQTVELLGLPGGAAYRVDENDPGTGFTASFDHAASGTLTAGATAETTVTNTYLPDPVTAVGTEHFAGKKTLVGRPWNDKDAFTFTVSQIGGPNVGGTMVEALPNPARVTVTDATGNDEGNDVAAFHFGDAVYRVPGTYTYTVTEEIPQDGNPGMSYARDVYIVTVVVTDRGNGVLEASSLMERAVEGSDGAVSTERVEDGVAAFTNRFTLVESAFAIRAGKSLDNRSGDRARDLVSGEFVAELRPVTPGAPMPQEATVDDEGPVAAVSNAGDAFVFGDIVFDNTMDGETFQYRIAERRVDGASDGVTYDGGVYYATVTVHVSEANEVAISRTYTDSTGKEVVDELGGNVPPTFRNAYDPEDGEISPEAGDAIHGAKVLTGREVRDGETFYFKLSEVAGNPETVLSGGPLVATATKDSMKFDFGRMVFKTAGTYRFTVREVADADGTPLPRGTVDGMAYDGHVCAVTVTVSVDPQDAGRLVTSVAYDNGPGMAVDGAVFENRYEARVFYGAKGRGGLDVTKTLSGRDMEEGEFSFAIEGADGTGIAGGATAEESAAKLAPADRRFANGPADDGATDVVNCLDSLVFDQDDAGKTFVYTVSELAGNLPGVTYDSAVYTVEIQVVDDGDGTMHTVTTVKAADGKTVSGPVLWDDHDVLGGNAATVAFFNTYAAEPTEMAEGTETGIWVRKWVKGAPTQADFHFVLSLLSGDETGVTGLDGGTLVAETNDDFEAGEKRDVTFGTIGFTKPGLYTFQVVESEGLPDSPKPSRGWVYDRDAKYITVEVTDMDPDSSDDGTAPHRTGKLRVSRINGNGQVFINSYVPSARTTRLGLSKTVEGTAFKGSFGFTLSPIDPEDPKWDNVELMRGSYTCEISQFGAGETKSRNFGSFRFKAVGVYSFTVSETSVNGSPVPAEDGGGWTYDRSLPVITVTAKDTNEEGERDGILHLQIDGNNPSFVNTYDKGGENGGIAEIAVRKTLDGRAWRDDDAFTFTLTARDGAPMPAEGGETATVTGADAEKVAHFGAITYSAAGTYRYTVSEDGGVAGGVVYDAHTVPVTVTVTDANLDGNFEVSVSYDNSGASTDADRTATDAAAFTNVYGTELEYRVEGGLAIVKTFVGHEMEPFRFTVTPNDEASAAKLHIGRDGASFTVKDGTTSVDGTASVGAVAVLDGQAEIAFTQGDAGQVYSYTVRESIPESVPVGYTYDPTVYTVTITSEDDGRGTLAVATRVQGGAFDRTFVYDTSASENETAYVPFTNEYVPTVVTRAPLSGVKTMTGRAFQDGDLFTFEVAGIHAPEDGGPAVAEVPLPVHAVRAHDAEGNALNSGAVEVAPKSGESCEVDFGAITFTEPGTYTYTLREIAPAQGLPGVVYSDAVHTAVYRVTGNGDGTLSVDGPVVDGEGSNQNLAWENSYSPQTVTDTPVGVVKVLENRTPGLRDGEFSFEMAVAPQEGSPTDGFVLPDPPTAANAADGSVSFGDIVFTKAGSYDVAVSEVIPDDASRDPSIIYDDHVFSYTVTVTDVDPSTGLRDGVLRASISGVEQGEPTFTNVYYNPGEAKDVSLSDDPTTSVNGQMVGVGDVLVYTVGWAAGEGGTVTVTDTVPAGTRFASVEDGGSYDEKTGVITWVFHDQKVGAHGVVSFSVEVAEDAAERGKVSNTATIRIGENDPLVTNEVTTDVAEKSVDDGTPDNGLQVGDILHYTVRYRNDLAEPAAVVVTDTLPAGLTVMEDSITEGGSYDPGTRTVTWTFEGVEPSVEFDAVGFDAVVNEDATVVENPVANRATVLVGNDEHRTNITGEGEKPSTGSLLISKEIRPSEGTKVNAAQDFRFKVSLTDAGGAALTGTYGGVSFAGDEGHGIPAGTAAVSLKHGEKISIEGIPVGAHYAVEEEPVAGYTPAYEYSSEDRVITEGGATVEVVNTYATGAKTYDAQGDLNITKVLHGRAMVADEFQAVISGDADAMRRAGLADGDAEGEVSAAVGFPAAGDGETVAVNPLAAVTFTKADADDGTVLVYTVSEADGGNKAVSYDMTRYRISLWATDGNDGTLTVHTSIETGVPTESGGVDWAEGSEWDYADGSPTVGFVNVYNGPTGPGVLNGATNLGVSKTIENRDWYTDETFDFVLIAVEGPAGVEVPLPAGTATVTLSGDTPSSSFGDISFSQAGTYVYRISEVQVEDASMAYDRSVYTVTVRVEETLDGTLVARSSMERTVDAQGNAVEPGVEATSGVASFTNVFDTATVRGSYPLAGVKRIVGREFRDGDEFTFTVTPDDGAPTPVDANGSPVTEVSVRPTEGTEAAVDFGTVNFTQTGTYAYSLAEVEGGIARIDYDSELPKTVTLHVTDEDNDGVFEVAASYSSDGELAWTNVYTPTPTSVIPQVSKTIEGRPLVEGEFSFEMRVTDPAGDVSTSTAVNAVDGTVTFGAVDMAAEGTYTVAIDEQLPAGVSEETPVSDAGVTYDTHTVTYTYLVTCDPLTDSLVWELEGVEGSETFANVYGSTTAGGGTAEIKGTKSLKNRAMTGDDEFSFVLAKRGDPTAIVETAVNDRESFSFKLDYTNADFTEGAVVTDSGSGARSETFAYTVYEVGGGERIGGIDYDARSFDVDVTLADDGRGRLTTSVSYPADTPETGLSFVNVYTGADVTSASLVFGKVLVGRDMAAGEFSFTASPYDPVAGIVTGAPVSSGSTGEAVANGQTGSVVLSGFTFDASMLGGEPEKTFYYRVAEANAGQTIDGVRYDDAAHYAGIRVTDDGSGNLSSAVTYYSDPSCTVVEEAPVFRNTYTPAPEHYPIKGFKQTSTDPGVAIPEGLAFGYTIENTATGEEYAATSNANGAIEGSVRIDGTGTRTFRISEVRGGTTTGGIAYDGTVYYLVLDVTQDPSTGAYRYAEQYYLGNPDDGGVPVAPDQVVFSNKYGSGVGTTLEVGAVKRLGGATFDQVGPFSFTVTETTNGTREEVATATAVAVDGGTATVAFSSIPYGLTVEPVTDGNGDGGEAVEPAAEQPTEEQPAEGQPAVGEVIVEEVPAGETPAGDDSVDGGPDGVQPVGESGTDAPSDGGADAAEPVEPGDAEGSGAPAEPVEPVSPEAPAVEETVAQPEVPVEGEVQTAPIADLVSVSEAIADDAGAEPYTGAAVDEGALAPVGEPADAVEVSDAPVEPAESAAPAEPRIVSSDIGLHTYEVRETVPAGAVQDENGNYAFQGMTYDGHFYKVIVDVEASYNAPSGTVAMTATVVSVDQCDGFGNVVKPTTTSDMVFDNSYAPTVPATVDLQADKVLTGRAMADGEFTFTVYDESGNAVSAGVAEGAGDGIAAPVRFGSWTIDRAGTFNYRVVENAGQGSNGVSYDSDEVWFSVTVADNYDGTLSATVNYPEGGIHFENAYRAGTSTSATIEGTKTLTGRAMAAGEFRFVVTEVTDGMNEVRAAGESTAAGEGEEAAIDFAPIRYDEPGEHDYVVTEVGGGAEKDGVVYDGVSFPVHVSVIDNLDGTMRAEVSYPDGLPRFVNSYEEPHKPADPDDPGRSGGNDSPKGSDGSSGGGGGREVPKTGDVYAERRGVWALATGGLGMLVMGGAVLVRRQSRDR